MTSASQGGPKRLAYAVAGMRTLSDALDVRPRMSAQTKVRSAFLLMVEPIVAPKLRVHDHALKHSSLSYRRESRPPQIDLPNGDSLAVLVISSCQSGQTYFDIL